MIYFDPREVKKDIDRLGTKKNKIFKVVATSGYFDPLHIGHLQYLEKAKRLGDLLVVIVNSDSQAKLKKGTFFMTANERLNIIDALKVVDYVVESIDEDASVCKTLAALAPDIFAKGGDRTKKEIPESKVCRRMKIKIVDGLGKKIQSSSELIKKITGNGNCKKRTAQS